MEDDAGYIPMGTPKQKRKRKLVQTRIDFQPYGRELKQLAQREGLSEASYVRRLVMKHLDELRPATADVVATTA